MHRHAPAHHRGPLARGFDWLLRNRATGAITIMQIPNAPLFIFLIASAARLIAHPHGTVGTVVSAIGTLALVAWACLEIFRGVNPFRRILGALVLAGVAVSFLPR